VLSLLIIDDVADIRRLVALQVESDPTFEVCGTGGTAREAIELSGLLRPDVLLLDLSLPDMDGLDALPLIQEVSPQTRIVMFSGFPLHRFGDRAVELGAVGCLEKTLRSGPLPRRLAGVLQLAAARP
jgi:DNA-binding NarL/FixJ family response regulator